MASIQDHGTDDRGWGTRLAPVTIAAIVGLGWGLAFGLVDGLPALLEGDPLVELGRRLLTLAFVAVWNALAFGLILVLVGLCTWGLWRLTNRQPSLAGLFGLDVGLCAALSAAAYGLHRYQLASPVIVFALALMAGGAIGWLVHAAAASQAKPGFWARLFRNGILASFGIGVGVLLGVVVFRHTVRDWKPLNPRVTDQVATPERPNIVLISIDALRADRLGVYGNDPAVSPRIDALARRGLVFGQAIAQSSSTVPSVSSFLTALYPTELGLITGRKWTLDDMRVTLAEALQAGGYRTQAYVTNGHLVPSNGYAQGFDGYVAPEPGRPYGLDRLRAETIVAGLACRRPAFVCDLFEAGYQLLFDPLLVMEDEGGRVNVLARRFLRLHGDEQFFLWLHYMEPHAAYSPRQAFDGLPPSVSAEREAFLRAWQPSNQTIPIVLRPDDVAALLALYDGEILDVDRWVGGIWDEIEAQGLADRTLLVVTADHGDEFGEHGGYGHGQSVYQELDRVPLIVVGPQVSEPGRVVETPVPLLDLMPTLLDAAGAPLPDPIRGQSLLPVLRGEDPPARTIHSESPARRTSYDDKSLRQGDYKLIYNVQLDRAELYDLQTDPGEQHDLAAAEPQRAAAMRDELRAWTASAVQTWASLPQAGGQAEDRDAAMEDALHQIGY
jgi:arylsulfatase A-like enzyme